MFDNVKVGDAVIRKSLHPRAPDGGTRETVGRVTKTMVVLESGERFRRHNGSFIGPVFSPLQIRFIRPEGATP